MTGRRRPMRRIGDLLPGLTGALGLSPELRAAERLIAWERVVVAVVPAAATETTLLRDEPGGLVVAVTDAALAQEIRLHAPMLLSAWAAEPLGGTRASLDVVVRPAGGRGRPV